MADRSTSEGVSTIVESANTTGEGARARRAPSLRFGHARNRNVLRSVGRYIGPMIRAVPRQMLRITFYRLVVCGVRYIWFAMILRRTKVLNVESGGVSADTVTHNLRGMFDLSVERSLRLIQPIVSLERVRTRLSEVKLLSIGARTEGELYNLYAHGFAKRNVTAIDLISYSPRVTLGDMHALDLPDSSFDVVLLGWVLAYSDNKARAAAELVRVARPGGVIAIGVEWSRLSVDELVAQTGGYLPGSYERLASVDHILSLFGQHVDEVYFRQDEQADLTDQAVGDYLIVFRVRK